MGARWRSYNGVVHVHTDQSDGGGTLDEVVQAAKACGIDFVVLTDHGTRGYGNQNVEGWHDGVLIMAGEEVTCDDGHFLAFETRENIGKQRGVDDALEEVRRQSGSVASIHHHFFPNDITSPPPFPAPLSMARADFVEIWSFTDDFLSSTRGDRALQNAAKPDRVLTGPTRACIKAWDQQLRQRPLVALGGLNAHQRKQPLLDWKQLFPFKTSFKTVRTVVLSPELPKTGVRARDMVWQALRQGHCYVANEAVAPSAGFRFEYLCLTGKTVVMGETTAYESGGRIAITAPTECEIVIRHNGTPLFWGTAREFTFPTVGPGSYRIELRLNRRAWIFSNAIRLVDELGIVQPTVSDFT